MGSLRDQEFTSKENYMKKTLLLVTLLLAMRSTGWASSCTVGTLASYIALGSGGCAIDGKTFTDFDYSGSGNFPIPASAITVTPCPSSLCSATGVLRGEEGFVFNAAWQVGPGQTLDSLIGYTVTSSTNIVDAFLVGAGMSAGGGGLASIDETLSNGENLIVSTIGSSSDSVTFPGVMSLTVLKDIALSGNAGAARISDVGNGFSQVPEASSMWLFGSGLLALGVGAVLRRKRKAGQAWRSVGTWRN
jgi:hypothetical protein